MAAQTDKVETQIPFTWQTMATHPSHRAIAVSLFAMAVGEDIASGKTDVDDGARSILAALDDLASCGVDPDRHPFCQPAIAILKALALVSAKLRAIADTEEK